MKITISWDKYLEAQRYMLANLDKLYFRVTDNMNIDIHFYIMEDATAFTLKFSI